LPAAKFQHIYVVAAFLAAGALGCVSTEAEPGSPGASGSDGVQPGAPPSSNPGTPGDGRPGSEGPSDNLPLDPSGEGAPLPAATPCRADSANAAGYCFRSVAIGGGGFVSGIVTSALQRGLIYARTDVGGAYRWDESTESWLPLNDWAAENQTGLLGVESLALDPGEPSRVYMLAGINYFDGGKTALLRSDDYGATFEVFEVTPQFRAHGNGPGRQNGERLAVDPNDGSILFVGTRDSGLFQSRDRGQTWARVASLAATTTSTGSGIAFVLFDPRSPTIGGATGTIYAGVSELGAASLYVSTDAGVSWAPVAGQPTAYAPQRAALSPTGELYVTYGNGAGPSPTMTQPMDQGAIWRLEPATGVWTDVSPLRGEDARAFGGISVDPRDPARLLATTINTYDEQPWGFGDHIFSSSDGGASWVDLFGEDRMTMANGGMPWIEDHAIHWAGSIEFDPFDPERAFVTSGNGVFMTKNVSAAPSTWSFAARGLEETVPLEAISLRGGPLVSVIGDYDGFVHDDVGTPPAAGTHQPTMGTTAGLAVAALAPERVARAGRRVYVSSDGARSWTEVVSPGGRNNTRLAYAADGSVLLLGTGNTVYRSADQGQSWTTAAGIGFNNGYPAADGLNPNKFYIYNPAGGFLASTDGGQSFAVASTLPAGGARRFRTVPGVEGEIWIALQGGGLMRSVDSGGSFQRIGGVDSCRAVGFGAAAPGQSFPAVYIWGAVNGGPRGIYRSDDVGVGWVRVNDDAHQYGGPGNGELITGDENVYGRVFMSTAGRGLIVGEPAGDR
jgi:photosystem II stability/assembly factor-like uncharacterized protein